MKWSNRCSLSCSSTRGTLVLLLLLSLLSCCIQPAKSLRVVNLCISTTAQPDQPTCTFIIDGFCQNVVTTSLSASVVFMDFDTAVINVFQGSSCIGELLYTNATDTSIDFELNRDTNASFAIVTNSSDLCSPNPVLDVELDMSTSSVATFALSLLHPALLPPTIPTNNLVAIVGTLDVTFSTSIGTSSSSRVSMFPLPNGTVNPFTTERFTTMFDGAAVTMMMLTQVDDTQQHTASYNLPDTALVQLLFPTGSSQAQVSLQLTVVPGPFTNASEVISLPLSCSRTIRVADTQAPSVTCPQNSITIPVTGSSSAMRNISSPLVSDDGFLSRIQFPIAVELPIGASVNISSTAQDTAGNTGECVTTITAIDAGAPIIFNCTNITVSAVGEQLMAPFRNPNMTAFDLETEMTIEVTFSVEEGTLLALGSHDLVARAVDPSGNVAECHFQYIVTDIPRLASISRLDVVVSEGMDITHTCSFTGYPKPDIRWVFDNVIKVQQQNSTLLSHLRFPSVEFQNFGTYCCRAASPLGEVSAPIITMTVRPTLTSCVNTTSSLQQTHSLFNQGNTNGPLYWGAAGSSDLLVSRQDVQLSGQPRFFTTVNDTALLVYDREVHAYANRILSAGMRIWSFKTQDEILATPTSGPFLLGNTLVITHNQSLVALDLITQQKAWEMNFTASMPCTGASDFITSLLCTNGTHLVHFASNSTSEVPAFQWAYTISIPEVNWPPAYDAVLKNIYITSTSSILRIQLATGQLQAERSLGSSRLIQPPAVLVTNLMVTVLIRDNLERLIAFATSFSDGSQARWEHILEEGETTTAHLSATDTTLAVPTNTRLLVLDTASGTRRWDSPFDGDTSDEQSVLLSHSVLLSSGVSLLQVLQFQDPQPASSTQSQSTTASEGSIGTMTTSTASATLASTTQGTTLNPSSSTSPAFNSSVIQPTTTTSREEMALVRVRTQLRMFITTASRFYQSWTEELVTQRTNGSMSWPSATVSDNLLYLFSDFGPTGLLTNNDQDAGAMARILRTCAQVQQPAVQQRAPNIALVTSFLPRIDITPVSELILEITQSDTTVLLTRVPRTARLTDFLPGSAYRIATVVRLQTGMALRSPSASYSAPSALPFPERGRVFVKVSFDLQIATNTNIGLASRIANNYLLVQDLRVLVCNELPADLPSNTACYVVTVEDLSGLSNRARRAQGTARVTILADINEANQERVESALLVATMAAVFSSPWPTNVHPDASGVAGSVMTEVVVSPTTTRATTQAPTTPFVSTTEFVVTTLPAGQSDSNTSVIVIAAVCGFVGLVLVTGLIILAVHRSRNKSREDDLFFADQSSIIEMMENDLRKRDFNEPDAMHETDTLQGQTATLASTRLANAPLPPVPVTVDRPPARLPGSHENSFGAVPRLPPAPPPQERPPLPLPTQGADNGTVTLMGKRSRMPLPGEINTLSTSFNPMDKRQAQLSPMFAGLDTSESSVDATPARYPPTISGTMTILPATIMDFDLVANFCSLEAKHIRRHNVLRRIEDILCCEATYSGPEGDVQAMGWQYKPEDDTIDIAFELSQQEQTIELLQLEHPNLCRAFGIQPLNPPLLLTELVSDGTVYSYMSSTPNVTLAKRFSLMRQAAAGLEYLSSKRIVHGNIWSQELFLHSGQIVKLSCTALQRTVLSALHLDHMLRHFRSRPRWAAPETLKGKFSAASDVWALAVTFWEIFNECRQQPYAQIHSVIDVIPAVQNGLRLGCPSNCCDELWQVMIKCWCINRADRPLIQIICKELDDLKDCIVSFEDINA
eukprot:m.214818 g.214818  ORF g.214818 m.214818 type:complete len:1780 (-) comp16968_c0_seq3:116-5455(-)